MTCTCDSMIIFFFNDTATTEIYTLSLHDALPIYERRRGRVRISPDPPSSCVQAGVLAHRAGPWLTVDRGPGPVVRDRKSTRLNSSHANISYAVFCLKKKKRIRPPHVFLHNLCLVH